MNNKTSIKSIRGSMHECSAGQKGEVLKCVITDCVLYPYRLGKKSECKRKEKQPGNAKNTRCVEIHNQ